MSETVRLAHHDFYPDRRIRTILANVRTIAMVGASTLWRRPSFYAMKYLQKRGYRVIPVNPARAGAEILGETVHPDIASVPAPCECDSVPSISNIRIVTMTPIPSYPRLSPHQVRGRLRVSR